MGKEARRDYFSCLIPGGDYMGELVVALCDCCGK